MDLPAAPCDLYFFDRGIGEQGLAGGRRVRLAEFVLWGSLAFALYAYGVYPFLLWLMSRAAHKAFHAAVTDDDGAWPTVTLLITAKRDEQFIVGRLQNAMALDYAPGRLQVLVGCAGEDDLTGLLARSFDGRRVEVLQFPAAGERVVLCACLRQARGEIVVFSDARTLMRPDALRRLAAHFHDPSVGGVYGKLVWTDSANGRLFDRNFLRLEEFLTRCETRLEFIPAVHRGIFAIRRDLCVTPSQKIPASTFEIAEEIHRRGYRLLYDEEAVATAESSSRVEETRRTRPARPKAFGGAGLELSLVGLRRGLVSSTFRLHRRLRRLCPGFLIAAFVSNACLSDDPFYLHCLLFHELFYICALAAVSFMAGGRARRLRAAMQSVQAKVEALGDHLEPRLSGEGTSARAEVLVAPAQTAR